ncbi:MAG: DUF3623 domain-containing protein [Roseiflexaceae bacterium]|nr:DUF3623 domain-containing protein [Roseiflexaceae bacterium]
MFLRHVLPALFALFIWWASTAAIMFLYRRPRSYRLALPLANLGLLAALIGLWVSRDDTSTAGAYLAFFCGVSVSGWHLLTFYTGAATGPQLEARHAHWPQLVQAVYASLYHELLAIGLTATVVALTWGGGNQTGTWTLLILLTMHQSAQLNVLLGVRNFDARMLPGHLDWVRRVVSRRTSNAYFPFSIAVTLALTGWLLWRALDQTASDAQAAGATMLCLMMAMALFEHALLMLPEPAFLREARTAQPALLPEE